MTKRATASALLTMTVIGGTGGSALAQSVAIEPTGEPPLIGISIDCDSSPESVTITNNTVKPLRLKRIGSTYQRRAGEPYRVKKTLKPGKGVRYTFGTGEGKGNRLTGSFIFDNEAADEGVLVKTNRGKVKVKCVDGTNALPTPDPEGPVQLEAGGESVDALDLLALLAVEPEVDEGYERALFEHWVDADGNGCDTREEVLIAESLTPAVVGEGCTVEGGTWYSAPDGDTLSNPASVDINHVVPLKEAWASGAYAWTPERREAFANDLTDGRTLQAVSAGANRQQGESDPARWLPVDREAACAFVTDWVAIKASWGLSVDQAERDAIELTLETCPERMVTVVPKEPGEPAQAG